MEAQLEAQYPEIGAATCALASKTESVSASLLSHSWLAQLTMRLSYHNTQGVEQTAEQETEIFG